MPPDAVRLLPAFAGVLPACSGVLAGAGGMLAAGSGAMFRTVAAAPQRPTAALSFAYRT
jgi:hypothetical protein